MAYKILLTGTIFTGKSTLLNHLKGLGLQNVAYIPELAREILSRTPELEKDPNLQDILFAEQIRREQEAEREGYDVIICDRGSLDIISHSRMFGHPIKPEWEAWNNTYSQVLLFKHDDFPFDTTRYSSDRDWVDFRDTLERHTENALTDYHLPFRLISGTIEQRAQMVDSMISGYISTVEGNRSKRER